MPTRRTKTRDRALTAVELHLSGATYAEIARRVGYRSESGARMAVTRDLARRSDRIDDRRAKQSARLEKLIGAHWEAATAGRNAGSAAVVLKALDSLSRLHGLDAAQRHLIGAVGVSEREFAERAQELLKITGDRPLRELAAPLLPPAERAAVFTAPPDDDDGEVWSNLGGPEGTPARPEPADPPPLRGVVERLPDDDTDDGEVPEVVDAEVVDDPPTDPDPDPEPCGCTRSIPASEVLTADGIPLSRAHRIGAYNPLAGWTPH